MTDTPLDPGHSPGFYDPIPDSDIGSSWFISLESQLSTINIDNSDDSEASTDLESHSVIGSQKNRGSFSTIDEPNDHLQTLTNNNANTGHSDETITNQSTNDDISISNNRPIPSVRVTTPPPPILPVAKRLRKRTIEQLYPYRIELERYRMNLRQTGVNVSRKDIRKEDGVMGNHHGSARDEPTRNEDRPSEEKRKQKDKSTGKVNGSSKERGNQDNNRLNTPDIEEVRPSDLRTPEIQQSSHESPTSETVRRRRRVISDAESEGDVDLDVSRDHDVSSPSSWSSPDQPNGTDTDSSEDDNETLAMFRKRVKGVLPPSFITLEYAKFQKEQKMRKAAEKRQQQREERNSPSVPQKGVARRKIRTGRSEIVAVETVDDGGSTDRLNESNRQDLRATSGHDDILEISDDNLLDEIPLNTVNNWQNSSPESVDDVLSSSQPQSSVRPQFSDDEVAEEDQIDYMGGTSRGTRRNGPNKPSKGSSRNRNKGATNRRAETTEGRTKRQSSGTHRTAPRTHASSETHRISSDIRSYSENHRPSSEARISSENHRLSGIREFSNTHTSSVIQRSSASHKPTSRNHVTSSSISISDVCQHMRRRGSTPRFLNVAERSAGIRTNHRPDNHRHKYISIEDNDYDSRIDSSALTLERWSRGNFARRSNGNRRQTSEKPTKRPIKWMNSHMVDMNESTSRQKPATKPLMARSTVEIRSNSKQSYLNARKRQFQTSVLEVPSGRFAIRRKKDKRDEMYGLGMVSQGDRSHGRAPELHERRFDPHTRQSMLRERQSVLREKLLAPSLNLQADRISSANDNPVSTIAERRLDQSVIVDRPILSSSVKQIPKKNKALRLDHLRSKHIDSRDRISMDSPPLFPVGVSVSCGIDIPANDLRFSTSSFIGRGFLKQILDGQLDTNNEQYYQLLTIQLGQFVINFEGSSFSSSLGRTISALKELMDSNMNGFEDEGYFESIEPFFNALFVYVCGDEGSTDDFELLSSVLHELIDHIWIKWTQWQDRGIFSHQLLAAASFRCFSLSLMILQSLSLIGVNDLASGEYIPAFVHDQLSKMIRLIFTKGGTGHTRDMICKHRSSLNRNIGPGSYLIESLVIGWTFLGNSNMQNLGTLISQNVVDINSPNPIEDLWIMTFIFCYIQQLSGQFNSEESTHSWKVPKLALSTILSQCSNHLRDDNFGQYLSICISRCTHLIHYWKWSVDRPLVVMLFDFFASRQFNNVEEIRSDVSLAGFFSKEEILLNYEQSDSSFNSFLKLAAFSIISLSTANLPFEIRKLNARITPLNSRHYSRKSALKISDLEALCNQYSILLVMFIYCPEGIRPSIGQLKDTNQLNDSHIRARSLGVSVWEKVTIQLMKQDKDIEPAMNWLNDLLENTVKEYDELEETTVDSSLEYERRTENQQTYKDFFVQTIQLWDQLIRYQWITNSTWYKVMSRILLKILRHVSSDEINDIALDFMVHFLNMAQKDVDNCRNISKSFHENIFRDYYQFMSNIIGSDFDHSRRILVKAVKIWALIAKIMVSNEQMNWESFFNSSYSWNWFADSGKRVILEPIWWSELLRENSQLVSQDQFSIYFESQFFNCLVTPTPIYQHRFITEYLKFSEKSYVVYLRDYSDKLSTSKAFANNQQNLLRSLILGLSTRQLDEPEMVRNIIDRILGDIRRNYNMHSNEAYHSFVEHVLSSIVELIELPHITNLDWFRKSSNFELAAVTLDTANVKKYFRMDLNDSSRPRLLMFLVYSLEGSLVNSSGKTFIQSVSSALTDVCISRECSNYILKVLVPAYCQVALRSEVGESILPILLETVTAWASSISSYEVMHIRDFSPLIDSILKYLKSGGFYTAWHPYWRTASIFYEFLRVILNSSFDKNVRIPIDEDIYLPLLKLASDLIVGERSGPEYSQTEDELTDEIATRAIFQSLGNYERKKDFFDDRWTFSSKVSKNKFTVSVYHSKQTRSTVASFVRQFFLQSNIPASFVHLHQTLMLRLINRPQIDCFKNSLIEALTIDGKILPMQPTFSTIEKIIF